jgi:transposase
MRIFLCTQDTDMRKSFDSLRGVIRGAMHLDPLAEALFVFKNKRGDRIKVLYWDQDGFAMWYKVLQRGTFQFPDLRKYSSAGLEIDASTMRMILDGIDLSSLRRRPRFRRPRIADEPHHSPDMSLRPAAKFSDQPEGDHDTP